MFSDLIKEKLKSLPASSGVYIMLDESGEIIYIGKARVLKNRVRQYFQNSDKPVKVEAMVAKIADFRYIITESEVDALLLENNLIKEHKPYYNILLKDDKNYAYIKINTKEPFPTLELTRKLKADGAKYFGPFMQGISVKQVIEIINAAYPIRTCKKTLPSKRKERPCLNYHLGLCKAPCAEYITKEEYALIIGEVIEFLRGKDAGLKKRLTDKMNESSEKLDFESALICRNHLDALNKIVRAPLTALPRALDADIFACSSKGGKCALSMLSIRKGKMVGGDNFSIEDGEEDKIISGFVAGFYPIVDLIPPTIIVESEEDIIKEYFQKLGVTVEVKKPQKGELKKLVDMAKKNALDFLEKSLGEKAEALKLDEALASLGKELGIPPPTRMECYDISHVSGTLKVASMVVFKNGKKSSSDYRRFKIKTVEGNDDFACMKEVLARRAEEFMKKGENFAEKPDLIIIDGGKGQLSSAYESLKEKGMETNIVSLAKREELIFRTDCDEPVVLSHKSAPLMMLQRIRDEAHRFAITYHRKLRADNMTRSILSGIEGIGKAKIDALYRKFRTFSAIKKASVEDLSSCRGISQKDAERIFEALKDEKE